MTLTKSGTTPCSPALHGEWIAGAGGAPLLGSKGKALALGELRGLMAKPSNHTELCIDETTLERMS